MAQREEEASELRAPGAVSTLCANGCGFHGNPATKNMCQSCFQSSCSGREKPRSAPIRSPERAGDAAEVAVVAVKAEVAPPPAAAGRVAKRCSGCRRKVGLMGFRCRCGEMFCAEHRYSDRHDCSFDYKAAGREAIERENPVVRAAKIVRV